MRTCFGLRRVFARRTQAARASQRATACLSGAKTPVNGSRRFSAAFFAAPSLCPWTRLPTRASRARVAQQAGVRLAIVGRGLPALDAAISGNRSSKTCGTRPTGGRTPRLPLTPATRGDPVEIVFTSGTTAEPRGVVLTHGNLLANLEPIEKRNRALSPLRAHFSSASFSRSSAPESCLRPVARNFPAADSRRHLGVSRYAQSRRSDSRDSRRARLRARHRAAPASNRCATKSSAISSLAASSRNFQSDFQRRRGRTFPEALVALPRDSPPLRLEILGHHFRRRRASRRYRKRSGPGSATP